MTVYAKERFSQSIRSKHMSQRSREIKKLIKQTDLTPSISYWNSLLNYFEKHKKVLDIDDVRALCDECERCRIYWNKERVETKTITSFSGRVEERKILKHGLGISRNDVNPDIYTHLRQMERNEEQKKIAVGQEQSFHTAAVA